MGNNPSRTSGKSYDEIREKPSPDVTATLYYLPGRGIADPIRWILAATDVSFVQKTINSREKFLQMADRQLIFGQLPLLQIDNLEIVQRFERFINDGLMSS